MRLFLIVLCLLAMFATGWHAVFQGTGFAHMRGAPQIQELVHAGTLDALKGHTRHKTDVSTDGRNVRLNGTVDGAAEREALLAAANGVPLIGRISDDLTVLKVADPFDLSISRDEGGKISLSGHVPSAEAEAALLAHAKSLAGNAGVDADLTVAAGAPEGDWTGMATTGLDAAKLLQSGSVALSGTTATVAGTAANAATIAALQDLIGKAPMGAWANNVAGAPPAGGFKFQAMKAPDGSIVLDGHAPDEATRAAIMKAAKDVSGDNVTGDLTIETGMPDGNWPNRVMTGLAALGATSEGLLDVQGSEIRFTGDVDTDADAEKLKALMDPAWQSEVKVINPTPVGDIRITAANDGSLKATGLLPEGLVPSIFAAMLPGLDTSELSTDTVGKAEDWSTPIEGLSIVLPRFETAEARIVGRKLELTGDLQRGFSMEGVEASLQSVLPRDWALAVRLTERPPLAEMVFSKRGAEIALSGVLPTGLDSGDALDLFGDNAGGEGLTTGGDGDPDAWRKTLAGIGRSMPLFASASGRVGAGKVDLNGALLPGYGREATQAWINEQLGQDWSAKLLAEETEPSEGDRRISLATGEAENFRQGFWLPDVSFPVSPARCKSEIDGVLDKDKIVFVTGSAEIDEGGATLLNRLAAVSVRCLNSSIMRLVISGHTDSVGNDSTNQRLSETRAKAVMQALVDRGVRESAISAVGFGESEPVASNNTAEGRAQNRRIEFGWFENE